MSAYRMHLPQNSPAHPRRGLADWTELMLKDHGFLRLRWHNLHQIDSHMWRSNQPTPARIKQCATLGINTIINLRGERDDGGWRLEAEACHKAGLTLVDFTARSRAAPDKPMLHATAELFHTITTPALLHCKSGADRAGIMSALYLVMMKDAPVNIALQQLKFWPYLHVSQAKTGVLDAFLLAYQPYQQQGMAFFDWVDDIYDADQLQAEFRAKGWANRLVDDLLNRE